MSLHTGKSPEEKKIAKMEGRMGGPGVNVPSSNAMPSGFGAKAPMPSDPNKGRTGTSKKSEF